MYNKKLFEWKIILNGIEVRLFHFRRKKIFNIFLPWNGRRSYYSEMRQKKFLFYLKNRIHRILRRNLNSKYSSCYDEFITSAKMMVLYIITSSMEEKQLIDISDSHFFLLLMFTGTAWFNVNRNRNILKTILAAIYRALVKTTLKNTEIYFLENKKIDWILFYGWITNKIELFALEDEILRNHKLIFHCKSI